MCARTIVTALCLLCSMKMVQTNRHVFRISRSIGTAPAYNFPFYTTTTTKNPSLRFTALADGSCFLRLCFPLPFHCCAFLFAHAVLCFHLADKRNFYVNNSAWRFVVHLTGDHFIRISHIAMCCTLNRLNRKSNFRHFQNVHRSQSW